MKEIDSFEQEKQQLTLQHNHNDKLPLFYAVQPKVAVEVMKVLENDTHLHVRLFCRQQEAALSNAAPIDCQHTAHHEDFKRLQTAHE